MSVNWPSPVGIGKCSNCPWTSSAKQITKGQVIAKFLFGVFNPPQNKQNNLTWGTVVVKLNFFVRFLGELKVLKRHFEISWPLELRVYCLNIYTVYVFPWQHQKLWHCLLQNWKSSHFWHWQVEEQNQKAPRHSSHRHTINKRFVHNEIFTTCFHEKGFPKSHKSFNKWIKNSVNFRIHFFV